MDRSLTARLLLVFALLFSQLGGLSHGIAHALEEQTQDQSQPHDRLCDLCATYAQLGTAFTPSVFQFVPGVVHDKNAFRACFTVPTTTRSAFSARAPPPSA